jgi:hypothetical protein
MADRTGVALYRSVRKEDFPDGPIVDDHAVIGVLYPSFEPTDIGKGRERPPDVVVIADKHGRWVIPDGGGTSLFNKKVDKVFKEKYWWFFAIPKGTDIPGSLRVRHTGRHEPFEAEHYQIEPAAGRMTVMAYKGALDNFARNAVVKAYEDAHGGA